MQTPFYRLSFDEPFSMASEVSGVRPKPTIVGKVQRLRLLAEKWS